jgi:hypothetical protein
MTDKHISDGGPAFPGQWYDFQPLTGDQVVREQWSGMSMRDYFAAKFAAAMLTATSADHDFPTIDYRREVGGPTVAERVATIAYRMADAMLKAREASND